MNQFEQQLVDKILEGVHEVEVKVVKEVAQLEGAINGIRKTIEMNMEQDTKRLDKHSEELDDHSERLSKLEEWKNQFEKSVANRIAISQSVAAIVAVVVAFMLSKVL